MHREFGCRRGSGPKLYFSKLRRSGGGPDARRGRWRNSFGYPSAVDASAFPRAACLPLMYEEPDNPSDSVLMQVLASTQTLLLHSCQRLHWRRQREVGVGAASAAMRRFSGSRCSVPPRRTLLLPLVLPLPVAVVAATGEHLDLPRRIADYRRIRARRERALISRNILSSRSRPPPPDNCNLITGVISSLRGSPRRARLPASLPRHARLSVSHLAPPPAYALCRVVIFANVVGPALLCFF